MARSPVRKWMLRTGALTLAMSLVAACGGNDGEPAASTGGEGITIDGELVIPQDLLEKARSKPGVFYTALNEDAAMDILKKFKSDTGITLELVRTDTAPLYERIVSEYGAGKLPADIISLTDIYLPEMAKKGIVVPHEVPAIDKIGKQFRDAENRWYASDVSPVSVAYNNQIIPPDQVPKSWHDLVERGRYTKGIGAIEPGAGGGGWTVAMFQRKELGGVSFWKDHAALGGGNLRIYTSHATAAQDVARGEISISPVTGTTLTQAIADGAPLSIANLKEGTPAISSYVGVTEVGQNPAAGKALLNWLMSKSGMTYAAVENGKYGVREDVPVPKSPDPKNELPPLSDLWQADPAEYAEIRESWVKEWYDIYGYAPTR